MKHFLMILIFAVATADAQLFPAKASRVRSGDGAPPSGDCVALADTDRLWINKSAIPTELHHCQQQSTGVFGWSLVGGGGGGGGDLLSTNNLSDLTSASTARTNLGLAAIASSGSASDLGSGTVPTARLGSGGATSAKYLRGDQTWQTIPPADIGTGMANSDKVLRGNGQWSHLPPGWATLFPALVDPRDPSTLTWVNQGGASYTDKDWGFRLNVPASASDSVRALVKNAPATPWSLTISVFVQGYHTAYNIGGICLRESSSGKLYLFGFGYQAVGAFGGSVAKFSSPTAWNAAAISRYEMFSQNPMLFLRVEDNGTNVIFSTSIDGDDFSNVIYEEARTTFMSGGPDQAGFFGSSGNSKPLNAWIVHWSGI